MGPDDHGRVAAGKTPPKRQLDLPQAFIKQFVAPHNSSSDGPEVQPLLVQLLLDGKPIAQPHRVPVKWSRNRVNERSGQISYKHKLLLSEADIVLLPEGAYVHTVKGTGLDSITLSCCTPQPGSRPQPQQPQQLPASSAAQPQASAASQHTTSSSGLLAGKRRVLQAALKVTSAAAKRQRSHPHPHPQPGLAGQRLGLAGAQRAISGEPRLPVPGGVLAGQRPAATGAPQAAAAAAGAALATSGAAGGQPQLDSAAPARQAAALKKHTMKQKGSARGQVLGRAGSGRGFAGSGGGAGAGGSGSGGGRAPGGRDTDEASALAVVGPVDEDNFLAVRQVLRNHSPMLPAGFVKRCFPDLERRDVGLYHRLAVELLLLPAGVAAAPDVTAATPGVQLLHSNLEAQVRKSRVEIQRAAAGARSITGQQQQQQQQAAGEVTAGQGHKRRYYYSISTLGSGSIANLATGGSGDCWLAGISRLGKWRVRLMLSLQQPGLGAQRSLLHSLSSVSQQGAPQLQGAAAGVEAGGGSGGVQQQQQQQRQAEEEEMDAGPFAAAAAAAAAASADADEDGDYLLDAEYADDDAEDADDADAWEGPSQPEQAGRAAAAGGVKEGELCPVEQSMVKGPRMPVGFFQANFPAIYASAGRDLATAVPLAASVVLLPPRVEGPVAAAVKPLRTWPCPDVLVWINWDQGSTDQQLDGQQQKRYRKCFLGGEHLKKVLCEAAAVAGAGLDKEARAAAAAAFAASGKSSDPAMCPLWLVALQRSGPGAVTLFVTGQLPADTLQVKRERSKQLAEKAAERRAAAAAAGSGFVDAGSGGVLEGPERCLVRVNPQDSPVMVRLHSKYLTASMARLHGATITHVSAAGITLPLLPDAGEVNSMTGEVTEALLQLVGALNEQDLLSEEKALGLGEALAELPGDAAAAAVFMRLSGRLLETAVERAPPKLQVARASYATDRPALLPAQVPCSMATAKHAAAALLLLLLVAHSAAHPTRPGQGRRMAGGKFRESKAVAAGKNVAVAGAPDTDVATSAVKPADDGVSAAAVASVNTANAFDLCYDLNANRTLAFADVAYWQGRTLSSNQFMADTTCYLQWLPIRSVTIRDRQGVATSVPLSCACLNADSCGRLGQQPCCRNFLQWRASPYWAAASSYVWQSKDATLGDGYVCEWIQTRPVQGFGIMVASVSYSVVTL
ncbi:hypothetical protein OEZ85_014461 [Tetradesmus obliquus]|uniref:Uncharacterized protein n=1 Tax=Tetradesmus obliquus TaxID=3088 RepID=A0ABY8UBA8_TETOB|nr:hypothetical protein OEZ85_014461 [Tetradesmus obliquus]